MGPARWPAAGNASPMHAERDLLDVLASSVRLHRGDDAIAPRACVPGEREGDDGAPGASLALDVDRGSSHLDAVEEDLAALPYGDRHVLPRGEDGVDQLDLHGVARGGRVGC